MKRLGARVAELECKAGSGREAVHVVKLHEGESHEEGLDRYGREKIDPRDLVVVIRWV